MKWFGSSIDIEDRKRAENSPPLEAQLQATLNVIPAYTWYAVPSGALIFVNERTADYLGIPKDHPWIGVNLDIEERKQAEFYLAEGQRLAHMAFGNRYWRSVGFPYPLSASGRPRTITESLVNLSTHGLCR